jgi:hypothetical protein
MQIDLEKMMRFTIAMQNLELIKRQQSRATARQDMKRQVSYGTTTLAGPS